jgi:toxin YoeB
MYKVVINKTADKNIQQIIKSGDKKSLKKVIQFLLELEQHPTTGSGNPEHLKHELSGYWSRRINKKDRLIYQIIETEVLVVVVSALGHYE